MKRILAYLKPHTRDSILAPLFKLTEALLELLIPLIVASIIDIGVANGNKGYILSRCGWMIGLGLLGLLCPVTAQYFAARAATGFTASLREALFAHIQTLSYADLDQVGTPTLLTRLTSDMNQVQNGLNLTLRLLLRSPFVVFGAMVMAFTVDAKAALVFVVTIPALFAVVFAIMLACIPLYRKVQEKLDRVLGATRENLDGVRVIRAFRLQNRETDAFSEKNADLTQTQRFVGRISALLNPLTYVIVNLAIVAILRTGAVRVDSGALTQGQVIALYNYMSQILVELIKFANLILNITRSIASGSRIGQLLEQEPSLSAPDAMPQPVDTDEAVSFHHVTFRCPGAEVPTLSDIDFTAKRGQTIGIIGGTGSGKTMLANLIGRFYDVDEGSVTVNGVDVRDYPLAALRAKLGLVPQKALLFRGTIRENLLWGDERASNETLAMALETAQAAEIVAGKEGGLDYLIEAGGRNLSGGQRQRLTIARALTRKPEILILDDSASALDFATDAALRHALRELPWHPTTFLISQRTASIRFADQILVLDEGRLVGRGTHGELLETCPVYREIYDSQFKKEDAR